MKSQLVEFTANAQSVISQTPEFALFINKATIRNSIKLRQLYMTDIRRLSKIHSLRVRKTHTSQFPSNHKQPKLTMFVTPHISQFYTISKNPKKR